MLPPTSSLFHPIPLSISLLLLLTTLLPAHASSKAIILSSSSSDVSTNLTITPISLPDAPAPPPDSIGCSPSKDPLYVADAISAAQSLSWYIDHYGPVTQFTKVSWTKFDARADEIIAAWVAMQNQCGLGVGGYVFNASVQMTIGFQRIEEDWCSNL
ncbi:hypothetical protein QBC35DRAFT_456167 [Podospora australis]|uniref:SCP domain-containing protein n=1 Tax=Podospora australis TaxID=1536484 RepID=A0AAN6WK61_9PEZI|nr:hypothetical protein QBC35DRAFT_456167 [Podospora australis]